MKEMSAVELRGSLSRVAETVEAGEPILLRLNRRPVGVIISVRDFEERFALDDASGRRQALVEEILGDVRSCPESVEDVLDAIRER